MNRERGGQGDTGTSEPVQGLHDRGVRLRDLRDLSGLTLTDADLMDLLDLGRSAFYKRKQRGLYRFLECQPRIGRRVEYSGALVQQWRDGAGKPQVMRLVVGGRKRAR